VLSIDIKLKEYFEPRHHIDKLWSMLPVYSHQDLILLKDVFRTIRNLSQQTAEDILEKTPCTKETALAIDAFFGEHVYEK